MCARYWRCNQMNSYHCFNKTLLLKRLMWLMPTKCYNSSYYKHAYCQYHRTMEGYWKLLVVIMTSLYLFLSCHGTSNQLFFNFPINNLLTCQVPNPAAGPQASMPEPRFRVPLQPGPTGTVWRPVLSQ